MGSDGPLSDADAAAAAAAAARESIGPSRECNVTGCYTSHQHPCDGRIGPRRGGLLLTVISSNSSSFLSAALPAVSTSSSFGIRSHFPFFPPRSPVICPPAPVPAGSLLLLNPGSPDNPQ